MGVIMLKPVKYLILVISLFTSSTLSCMEPIQPSGMQPIGMQPTGAVAVSQSGLVNYTVKPNTKNITTNNPAIEASLIDLSDSMKASQREIFVASGFIPMLVTVTNKSDKEMHISPDVLDFNVGLSVDKVKDSIIKKFNLKKYDAYAAIIAYKAIILLTLITVALYFPYDGIYSLSNNLLACATSSSGTVWNMACSLFSQIPSGIKFLTSATTLSLALTYLEPSMFMNKFYGLIDKYYRMRATWSVPSTNVSELNQAINFVVTSSNNKAFDITSKSNKQFVIFVKSADATAIKNGTTFPILKF